MTPKERLEIHREIERMSAEMSRLNKNVGTLSWAASCLLSAAEKSDDKAVLKAALLVRQATRDMEREERSLPPVPRRRPTLVIDNDTIFTE